MARRCRRTRACGTTQNKADVRVDFDQSDRAKWRFDAGFASSNGLIIVAPGPDDANPMRQTYGSAEYTRGSASFTAMTSIHSARYAGLLTTDGAGISSQSLQLDAKDNRVVAAGTSSSMARRSSIRTSI